MDTQPDAKTPPKPEPIPDWIKQKSDRLLYALMQDDKSVTQIQDELQLRADSILNLQQSESFLSRLNALQVLCRWQSELHLARAGATAIDRLSAMSQETNDVARKAAMDLLTLHRQPAEPPRKAKADKDPPPEPSRLEERVNALIDFLAHNTSDLTAPPKEVAPWAGT